MVVPLMPAFRSSSDYLHRLVVIFLAFSPSFIILTISYEGLFYFAYCVLLITWVRLEHHGYRYTNAVAPVSSTIANDSNGSAAKANGVAAQRTGDADAGIFKYRPLTLADARISLFSLFLLQSAFFGTGNIASISTFSLEAVYRLIPVFDPFSQGALLILKILVPFAVLSAILGILTRRLGVSEGALFMLLMGIGDYMTIRFFWAVRDEGSWLEIGSTISQFCIASALSMFVTGLEAISEVMVRGVEFDDDEAAVVETAAKQAAQPAVRRAKTANGKAAR